MVQRFLKIPQALGLFLLPFFIFSMINTAHANVESPLSFYVGGKLGYVYNLPTHQRTEINGKEFSRSLPGSHSMAIGAMGGLSYKFIPQLGIRSELEYLYRIPSTKEKVQLSDPDASVKFQTQSHTLLANIYLDYYILPELTVYAGGGLGMSIIESTYISEGRRPAAARTRFAAQGGAGIAYTFFNKIVLDFNVRYTHLGQWRPHNAIGTRVPSSTVEALIGVAYKF